MKFTYMKMTTDGTTVKRYDGYEAAGTVKEFEALNQLGEQGWELVSVLLKGSDHIFYLRLRRNS